MEITKEFSVKESKVKKIENLAKQLYIRAIFVNDEQVANMPSNVLIETCFKHAEQFYNYKHDYRKNTKQD